MQLQRRSNWKNAKMNHVDGIRDFRRISSAVTVPCYERRLPNNKTLALLVFCIVVILQPFAEAKSEKREYYGLFISEAASKESLTTTSNRSIDLVLSNRSWYYGGKAEKKEKHLKSRDSSKKAKTKKKKKAYCIHGKGGKGGKGEHHDDDDDDEICDETYDYTKKSKKGKGKQEGRYPDYYGDYYTPTPSMVDSPTIVPPVGTPLAPPVNAPVTPPTLTAPVAVPNGPPVSAPVSPPISVPVASPPVAAPVDGPVAPPITVPIAPPVDAPVSGPVGTPIASPVAPPVEPPVSAPVAAPADSPVSRPNDAPVAAPVAAPVTPPIDTPVATPANPPVDAPIAAPVVSPPIAAPVSSPVTPPVSSPQAGAVDPPVGVPVSSPVTPPVAPPVSQPVAAPVTTPISTPVDSPVSVPAAAPVTTPIDAPVSPPVDIPVAPPVDDAPVAAPVAPPVSNPVSPPLQAPTDPPVDAPVASPASPPVTAPVNTPVDPPAAVPIAATSSPTVNIVAATAAPIVATTAPTIQNTDAPTQSPQETPQTDSPTQGQAATASPTVTLYRQSLPFEIVFGLPGGGGGGFDGFGEFGEAQVVALEFLESYFETIFASRDDVVFSSFSGEILDSDPSIPSASFQIEIFFDPSSSFSPTEQEIDILTELSVLEEPFLSSFLAAFAELGPDNPYSEIETLEYIPRPDLVLDDRGGTKSGAKLTDTADVSVTPFRLSFLGTKNKDLSHEATEATIRTTLTYLDEYLSMTFDAVERDVYSHVTGKGKGSGDGKIGFLITVHLAKRSVGGYTTQEIDSAVERAFTLPAVEALVISLHAMGSENPYSASTMTNFQFIPDFDTSTVETESSFRSPAMFAALAMLGICLVATLSAMIYSTCRRPDARRNGRRRELGVPSCLEPTSQSSASVEMRIPLGQKRGGEEDFDLSIDSGHDPLIWWSGSSGKS